MLSRGEPEGDHISVLHHILLAFEPRFTVLTTGGLTALG